VLARVYAGDSRRPAFVITVRGMEIREVMTGSVVTTSPERSVREVAELMRERNVGSVVLVDNADQPVGFITDRDLTVGVLAEGHDGSSAASGYASNPVITATPDLDLREAAALMVRHGIRRLPVVDAGRLSGIVTLDDLAARTGDPELGHDLMAQITRAALPEFYFHNRGG
jgi:CBS domain-containing protein